jgi:hypothetical protein
VKYFWKYGIPSYVTALTGNIYFNGSYSAVKIYDGMVPPNATSEQIYIVLGERLTNQTSNKTMNQFEASLLVDVVSKSNNFGFASSDDVAQQIMQLINSTINPNTMPDFQVVTTRTTTHNLSGLNPMDNVFRTLIRFEHKILQQP